MQHSTLINILIDNSRFMQQYATDAVQKLNQLLADEQQQNGEITVSYSTFADEYQSVFVGKPLNEAEPFNCNPNGQSSLLESACRMIDEAGEYLAAQPEEERPDRVLFVIATAGQDSVSGFAFSAQKLAAKIRHQTEKYSWQFVFPLKDLPHFHSAVVRIREPIIKPTFQFAADLNIPPNETTESVFQKAIDLVYEWISIKLGAAAPNREEFNGNYEFDKFILPSLKIATIPAEGRWCSRIIHADEPIFSRPAIAGLTWTSDISLHNNGNTVHFAMRITITALFDDKDILPIRPRLIPDIAKQIGFTEALPIQSEQWTIINNDADIRQFTDAVSSPLRQIPIVLVALQDEELLTLICKNYDGEVIKQSILALGYVFYLPEQLREVWNENIGNDLSVSPGSVRIYYPQTADAPVYTADEINSWQWSGLYGKVAFAMYLKDTLADYVAAKPMDWGSCLFEPKMRSRIAELRREQLAKGQFNQDYVLVLEDDNAAQKKELELRELKIEQLKQERFKLKNELDSLRRPQQKEFPIEQPKIFIRKKAKDELDGITGDSYSTLLRVIKRCSDKNWRKSHTDYAWNSNKRTNLTVIKPGNTAERLAGFERDNAFYITHVFESHEEYETKLPQYSIESMSGEEYVPFDTNG